MPAPETTSEAEVENLLADLVRIESVTPWLIPDGSGEGAIARFMADWLADLEVEVQLDEVEPGRPNLIARLRGTGGGPTLCLNAHSDTVGYANWADRALSPVREAERLIGLGVADDKACCALALLVLRSMATNGVPLRGDLMLACTIDEEGSSVGTTHLMEHHEMDAAIVLAPEVGVDAIVHMAEVVDRLHRLDREVFVASPDPMNGRTVFHTGTIRGGTDYATYPNRAVLGIEIGTQPGEHLSNRVAEIEGIFAEIKEVEPRFRGEVNVALEREPFKAEGHEALWEALDAATVDTLGRPLEPAGLNAWTDAALMQAAGVPTILFGPLGGNFHAPEEWVSVPEIVQAASILEGAIVRFCG
jgi:acetylornithine deacetylase/succinyl-diaminopimelate desuccinylase-like protein